MRFVSSYLSIRFAVEGDRNIKIGTFGVLDEHAKQGKERGSAFPRLESLLAEGERTGVRWNGLGLIRAVSSGTWIQAIIYSARSHGKRSSKMQALRLPLCAFALHEDLGLKED